MKTLFRAYPDASEVVQGGQRLSVDAPLCTSAAESRDGAPHSHADITLNTQTMLALITPLVQIRSLSFLGRPMLPAPHD